MKYFLQVLQKFKQKKKICYSGPENPNFTSARGPHCFILKRISLYVWCFLPGSKQGNVLQTSAWVRCPSPQSSKLWIEPSVMETQSRRRTENPVLHGKLHSPQDNQGPHTINIAIQWIWIMSSCLELYFLVSYLTHKISYFDKKVL